MSPAPSAPSRKAELGPEARTALEGLLLALADDELVIGYWDSEWTGIAPALEEDVAMSSIAQDEIGHARALYGLLAELTGTEPDALAYDRPQEAFRHARLLDHPRTDWALTVARRYLYETADAVRLEALAGASYRPLAELVAKIRREESYHMAHAGAWFERLATAEGEARRRLEGALARLEPDAATPLVSVPGEAALVGAGILTDPMAELEARWRATIAPTFGRHGLGLPGPAAAPDTARTLHGPAFEDLWAEMTMVRRTDPTATW
jgi:ring-1,2-phenylacetyl-CoA epoxidase subunit PaaC